MERYGSKLREVSYQRWRDRETEVPVMSRADTNLTPENEAGGPLAVQCLLLKYK
jgi:hypothetical protein